MLLISLSLFGLTACQDGSNTPTYDQITAKEAKTIMDTETDHIIIPALKKNSPRDILKMRF